MKNDFFNGNIVFESRYVLSVLEKYLPLDIGGTIIKLEIEKIVYDKITSFVARYRIRVSSSDKEIIVYGTAHKEKTNELAFKLMPLLNVRGITKQIPIFYDKANDVLFYIGVPGVGLDQLILERPIPDSLVMEVGKKIARLHMIPVPIQSKVSSFEMNYSILDPLNILSDQNIRKRKYQVKIKDVFEKLLIRYEKLHIDKDLCLTHGDFHPQNVIVNIETGEVSIIDLTAVSYAHYGLDIGTFLHQIVLMCGNKIQGYRLNEIRTIFMNSYFDERKIQMDPHSLNIIYFFEALSSIRGAVYYLIDEIFDEDKASYLISQSEIFLEKSTTSIL